MTLPFPEIIGPLNEHIPLLIKELKKNRIGVIKHYYGRRSQQDSWSKRIFHQLHSIICFTKIVLFKDVDLIQINSSFDKRALTRDVFFVSIAKGCGKSIFIKMHGSFNNLLYTKNIFWVLLSNILFKLVNQVGVLSSKEKEEFSEIFKFSKDKFVVVKNPIDLQTLRQKANNINYGQTKFKILFASRILKEKGIFDVINAIPDVIAKVDARFILAGSGRDKTKAQSTIKMCNLSPWVTWLGYIPSHKMKNVYNSASIFVFPTYFPEGMPMALVNALASGMPIITTRIRFAYDYLKEERNCLFVDTGNPHKLAEKIVHLSLNQKLMEQMSKNNLKLADRFDVKDVIKEYISLYKYMSRSKARERKI